MITIIAVIAVVWWIAQTDVGVVKQERVEIEIDRSYEYDDIDRDWL